MVDSTLFQIGREIQELEDSTVHRWYRFVLAYPDHLITDLLQRFGVDDDDIVLDPFCGTGTTLVECKKAGIHSVGIDANPSAIMATQVKVRWEIDPELVQELCNRVVASIQPISERFLLSDKPLFTFKSGTEIEPLKQQILTASREGQYIIESGMLKRGWIDEIPFYISIALLTHIKALEVDSRYKQLLRLALASCMVESVANVRFGPEIYVVSGSGHYDVLSEFQAKVSDMLEDLQTVQKIIRPGKATVITGDSRKCAPLLEKHGVVRVNFVITSPPYPTEKDYTRNTRLELVYLGFVHDRQSLRSIKKQMVRSHSKGVYKADKDGRFVAQIPEIRAIADELREKIQDKTYGFAKLYPRIIEEYFGGMYLHLRSLSQILEPGGKAAYVVGEQRTYLQTYTPTGKLLGLLAERPEIGFRIEDIPVWRVRRGTTGSGDALKEEIVILKKVG